MTEKNSPFPDRETFYKIYDNFCETNSPCSGLLNEKYKDLEDMYYDFYNRVEEEVFRLAYEAGWNAAKETNTFSCPYACMLERIGREHGEAVMKGGESLG